MSVASLQQYVNTHTHLDYYSTHFHERLIYILTQKKLGGGFSDRDNCNTAYATNEHNDVIDDSQPLIRDVLDHSIRPTTDDDLLLQ